MPAQSRTRLYREILTPAFHRRFTQAAEFSLLFCYLTAIITGDKSSILWSWFPLGPAGIRTLLLFLSPLLVFVLRVAQLHCGIRSTVSPFHTFRRFLSRRDVLETSFCYVLSALLFSEVYIWSVPSEANLSWVLQARSWERQRLNERPIYLRSLYLGLALFQTADHLWFDYDKIKGSADKAHHGSSAEEQAQSAASPANELKSKFPKLLQRIGIISLVAAIIGPIIYSLTVRKLAWRTSLACARFLRWDIPATAELSIIPPYHITLVARSLLSGFCLLLLWQGSNLAFGVYVAQEPIKRGQPLTQDSNDPNGSLLNGLKSSKLLVKVGSFTLEGASANNLRQAFSFWELALISKGYPARRVSIFKDIDRSGGPAWSQISSECLKMIQGITTRISEHINPSSGQQASIQPGQLQSLPRIGIPPKEEPVFLKSPPPSSQREMIEGKIGSFARSYGNHPPPTNGSPIVQQSKHYLEQARTKLLTPEQQEAISPAHVKSTLDTYLIRFLRIPYISHPFRQTFARRIRSIAFGQPFSQFVSIVDAIDALTNMATASIKEDDYGKVAKDVPAILKTFTMTHQSLERLANTLQPHWTDVEFAESQRQVEDVQVTLAALRHGLAELLKAFGGFAREIGLEDKDMRTARAIAGNQMQVVKN
ncbi:MAG: hypothetical protein Q9207_006381 [Kuettlingeria erythrocarpa]